MLEELGLKDWKPTEAGIACKTFADFQASGRLDAEYYQPKYDEIEKKIYKFPKMNICEIFDIKQNSSPSSYSDYGVKVIKTKNVRIPAIDFDDVTDYSCEANIKIEMGDLIFAAMGVGSLGRMSYIFEVEEPCTTDGTLRIFRTKKSLKNQYYEIPTMLFMTSKIGQELIYRKVIGSTGIISIGKENVMGMKIPIISIESREKCDKIMKKSFSLRKESKRLLDLAKRAVEVAIKQGESTALKLFED